MPATLLGVAELIAKVELVKKATDKHLTEKVRDEANKVMELSKARTPVATGALRESHEVVQEKTQAGTITFLVQAGAGIDYALIVHENVQAHHPVGQAKFLESAALEVSESTHTHFGDGFNIGLAEVLR